MTVVLEGIAVIVPAGLAGIEPGAPAAFRGAGAWHDGRLYCETMLQSGEAGLWVDPAVRHGWENFVAASARTRWKDFCIASSRHGLHEPCDWAEYDPVADAVWCPSYAKEPAFGGRAQFHRFREQFAAARASAEECYTRMYDSRTPRDDRDDALGFLSQAMRLARLLGDDAAHAEIKTRHEHINAVYRAQFQL